MTHTLYILAIIALVGVFYAGGAALEHRISAEDRV